MARLPNDRVNRRVSLFRRKVWASNVMYRDSTAEGLVGCANPAIIPSQKPQKSEYINLVDFLMGHCTKKVILLGGYSSRILGGLLRETAVSAAMSGSRVEGTCRCSHCCRST